MPGKQQPVPTSPPALHSPRLAATASSVSKQLPEGAFPENKEIEVKDKMGHLARPQVSSQLCDYSVNPTEYLSHLKLIMGFPQDLMPCPLSVPHTVKSRAEPELSISDCGFVDTWGEHGVAGLIPGNSSATAQRSRGKWCWRSLGRPRALWDSRFR